MSGAILTAVAAAAAAMGIALLIHASWEARNIAREVNDTRSQAAIPPLPVRHFVDFAKIAGVYADTTGRGGRVLRTCGATTLGAALFVAGSMALLSRLHLPH